MTNQQRSDLALAGGIVLLALAVFAVAGAMLVEHFPDLKGETVTAAFTFVLAAFTGLLAWSTIKLWRATKEIGERADSVIRTSERAYVKMSHVHPGLRETGIEGVYRVTVEVTNFGRTPARVTDAMLHFVELLVDTKLPVVPDYTPPPDWEPPKAFLVINETFSFTLSQRFVGKIEPPDPTHEVYAIGYVDYEDSFGRRYRSGYARLYKPTRNTGGLDVFPTEESRSNLVFVTQEGYNYDVCLDDEGSPIR